MLKIPKELTHILNPENKMLTATQWQNAYDKYLLNVEKKKEMNAGVPSEKAGVCACGNKQFKLKLLPGTKGKMERTCSNEQCDIVIIMD